MLKTSGGHRKFLKTAVALFAIIPMALQSVQAQSILRDAETEKLFDDMSVPLIKAAGLDPRNVRIILVGDP